MSEILNEEVDTKKSGFSRRRVVKGVAWTLPVISTAIASPAAAASGLDATASLLGAGSAVAFNELSAPGQNRTGTGPTGFQIKNNGGAIQGSIAGLIRIEPTPSATGDPGVGVRAVTNATLSSPSLSASNVFTATFSVPGMASNATSSVPITFYYKGKKNQKRNFLLTLTVTYPDNKVEILTTTIALT